MASQRSLNALFLFSENAELELKSFLRYPQLKKPSLHYLISRLQLSAELRHHDNWFPIFVCFVHTFCKIFSDMILSMMNDPAPG